MARPRFISGPQNRDTDMHNYLYQYATICLFPHLRRPLLRLRANLSFSRSYYGRRWAKDRRSMHLFGNVKNPPKKSTGCRQIHTLRGFRHSKRCAERLSFAHPLRGCRNRVGSVELQPHSIFIFFITHSSRLSLIHI